MILQNYSIADISVIRTLVHNKMPARKGCVFYVASIKIGRAKYSINRQLPTAGLTIEIENEFKEIMKKNLKKLLDEKL